MKRIILLAALCIPVLLTGQEDLLEDLEADVQVDQTVSSVFKGLKVVNFESTKLAAGKDLYFIVSHRFGTVKNGFEDLFGLDDAVTQLKFIYGIFDWLNISISRSSLLKTYGGHLKYRLVEQRNEGFPVTVVGYNLLTINSAIDKDQYSNFEFADRIAYTNQLIISRKVSKRLSLLVAPTHIHENLATRSIEILSDNSVRTYDEENDQFAVGFGGRFKLTSRWSLNADYGLHLNRNANSVYKNPLSIGIDLETGGHVFQMHFTNAQAMYENGFLVRGAGDWSDGDFYFGFNLSRVF